MSTINYRGKLKVKKIAALKNWNRKKFLTNSLIPLALLFGLIGGSFIFLYSIINNNAFIQSISLTGVYFQYFILLSGIIATSLLLWYEIDKNNPVLQKVCSGIAKGDCNAILTGKQARVFSWLSWSEVGFFYFSGSLLGLLFAGHNIASAILF